MAQKRRWLAVLTALLLTLFVAFPLFAPAVYALPGDTGTTAEGFEWVELADAKIAITGYSGAGGNIIIPSSIESLPVTEISNAAFASNAAITGAVIPSSVSTIRIAAFLGTGLTSIDIPSSVTAIETSAFSNCSSLTTVTLHAGLLSIGDSAFYNTGLLGIDIPSTVSII